MLDLSKYQPQWVSIADINVEDTAFIFRKDMNVADLAASLKAEGQKFSIVLWRRADGSLHIISGFRRVTAARQLGWEKVMGVVIPEADLPMDEALRLNFLENMARKSLNNLDIMFACQKLSRQGKSNVEIGKLIGKSEAQVRRYIKVADAPADIQQKVGSGQTTLTDATDKATRRDDEFKNMYVKSTKNGFKVILNYNRKRDKIDEIKAFLNKVMAILDGMNKRTIEQ